MLVYTMEACVANKRIETIDQAANKGKAVFLYKYSQVELGAKICGFAIVQFYILME